MPIALNIDAAINPFDNLPFMGTVQGSTNKYISVEGGSSPPTGLDVGDTIYVGNIELGLYQGYTELAGGQDAMVFIAVAGFSGDVSGASSWNMSYVPHDCSLLKDNNGNILQEGGYGSIVALPNEDDMYFLPFSDTGVTGLATENAIQVDNRILVNGVNAHVWLNKGFYIHGEGVNAKPGLKFSATNITTGLGYWQIWFTASCANSLCQNGGSCSDGPVTNFTPNFTCTCTDSYTGANCETQVSDPNDNAVTGDPFVTPMF